MNTDNKTLIIVPTYNERENVPSLVREIFKYVPEAHVCIVDDNSPDGTAAHAEELFGRDPRFSVLRREGQRGLGRSYVDGYRKALAEGYARLVQMDADFSHDPKSIPALIEASAQADVVVGSRYCPGGGIGNWPLRRRLLSRFANRYVGTIIGLRCNDSTSGFRCYNRRALELVLDGQIVSDGYAFLVESMYWINEAGLRVREVPIIFVDRREGQSKISRGVIFESVLLPWRLRLQSGTRPGAQLLGQTQD